MAHTIQCTACRGSGRQPLPKPLADTLGVVVFWGPLSADDVYLRLGAHPVTGVGITAIHNRLDDLRLLGLVKRTRRKAGRGYEWATTAKGAK